MRSIVGPVTVLLSLALLASVPIGMLASVPAALLRAVGALPVRICVPVPLLFATGAVSAMVGGALLSLEVARVPVMLIVLGKYLEIIRKTLLRICAAFILCPFLPGKSDGNLCSEKGAGPIVA